MRTRSIERLAAERGVPEAEVLRALIASDDGGPAHAAPWWPELLRLRPSVSLRALARKFETEPRRIRRALARTGLRAGGLELSGDGVPGLAGVRSRLGREPDRALARAVGVSVEAVQGERNRLGIPAFLPGETLRLTLEEEAWIRGPERGARARMRPDEAALQVVRRPSRGDERWPEAGPRERRSSEPGMALAPRAPSLGAWPSTGSAPLPERVTRSPGWGFFERRAPAEIEQYLQPTRAREGRQRIVRADTPRGGGLAPPVSPPAPAPPLVAPTLAPPLVAPTLAPPLVAPTLAPPLAPTLSTQAAPRPAPALRVWHVRLPGEEAPMVIEAADVGSAVKAASELLPPDLWDAISILLFDGGSPIPPP